MFFADYNLSQFVLNKNELAKPQKIPNEEKK